jgi:hypothetical protein
MVMTFNKRSIFLLVGGQHVSEEVALTADSSGKRSRALCREDRNTTDVT